MNTRHRALILALALALFLAACGEFTSLRMKSSGSGSEPPSSGETTAAYYEADKPTGGEDGRLRDENAGNVPPDLALRGRKLIREGQVSVKVKDVVEGRARIEALAKEFGGFVSNVQYQAYTDSRSMQLTVRVPADSFPRFVDKIKELGNVESEAINVIDVTDQYLDIDRRIKTNEMLAARLEQLVNEKSYQFKDLLEVERELARLRQDTEQLQGALKGLDDRIALSTLTVTLSQDVVQKVVPPDSVFSPLFNSIENAGPRFKGSVRGMMAVAGFLINLFIWVAPWFVLLIVVIYLIKLILRVRRARRKKA